MTIIKKDADTYAELVEQPPKKLSELKELLSAQQANLDALKNEPIKDIRQRGTDDAEARQKVLIADIEQHIIELQQQVAEVEPILAEDK